VEVLHNQGEKRWRGRIKEPVRGWISLLATDNGERWAIQEHLLATLLPAECMQAAAAKQANGPRPALAGTGTAIVASPTHTRTSQKSLNLGNATAFAHTQGQMRNTHAGPCQKPPAVLQSSASFGVSTSQQAGMRTHTMVRATSFGSPCTVQPLASTVRSGHGSQSVSIQPGRPAVGVVPLRRANSLPPSMPSSVHFSVRDEPQNVMPAAFAVTHVPRVVPPPQLLVGQKHSARNHATRDFNVADLGVSSDGAQRQRSTAVSVHSSTTCTPSCTPRGPLESVTRSPSWVANDSPVDTTPGQQLLPEGPFVSTTQDMPENSQVLALGAHPHRSPHTREGASLDTLPPQND